MSGDLDRFNRHWIKGGNGCHIWQSGRHKDGYGNFRGKSGSRLAHWWLFEHVHGWRPEVVMHTCDNPPCVNIDHLRPGTQWENIQDRVNKGRSSGGRNGRGLPGSAHGGSKLMEDQVLTIRALYQDGKTQQKLADEFQVSRGLIGQIVRNKVWRHI